MQDNSSDAATFAQFGEYLETEGEGLLEGSCEEPDANLIALAKEDLESDCNLPATPPGTNGTSASGPSRSGRQRLHKRVRRRPKAGLRVPPSLIMWLARPTRRRVKSGVQHRILGHGLRDCATSGTCVGSGS
jgi:hypothetical protein